MMKKYFQNNFGSKISIPNQLPDIYIDEMNLAGKICTLPIEDEVTTLLLPHLQV